jgi:hypothetical protein
MRAALRFWRYLYGENPLHLLVMVGCFALVGYVVSFVYPGPEALALLIWFAGAVLAHDLVLYPLYALADQPLVIGRWARRRVLPRHPPLVPAINHIRVPVLGSAVLGLIYFPTITNRGEDAFRFTAGLGTAGIYQHWLLITGVLFLGSAVVYALRLGAAAGRGVLRRRRAVAAVEPPVAAGDGVPPVAAPSEEPVPATSGESAPEKSTPEDSSPADSAPAESAPMSGEPERVGPADVTPEREGPDSMPRDAESETEPRPLSDAGDGERS